MKEQPQTGMNRTGVQMSPFDSQDLKQDVNTVMPKTSGDEGAIAAVRSMYISDADAVGSVPPPGTLTGALVTGTAMLTGSRPQLLIDKLGERAAFERASVRLYEALITKVQTLQQEGVATLPVEKLVEIKEEEAGHFAMVAEAIQSLGADPTAMTPCADLAGVESMGLIQAVTDPRTTVAQSLHSILVAEMTDNNGWEMLIALAREQNHDSMVSKFTHALERERDHLQHVQSWFEESTLGTTLAKA